MYFRVKAKKKKGISRELQGFLLILVGIFLGYCLILPDQTGAIGQSVARFFGVACGKAAYLIPVLFFWWGMQLIRPLSQLHARLDLIWSLVLLLSASAFFSIFGSIFYGVNFGGWTGKKINPLFHRLFGDYLALGITAGLIVYVASQLLRVSLRKLIAIGWQKLLEDYGEWQKARELLRKSAPPKIKSQPKTYGKPEPGLERPGIKQEQPVEPNVPPKIITTQQPKPIATAEPKKQPVPRKQDVPPAESKPAVPLNYVLPSVDILADEKDALIESRHEEHLANAELLTKTLADFDISAKVKEIIPGPVVTRYDIELAPGIKLQAVSALSENIALSMRSPSVRIVPVPEKSAVGIEVPNSKSKIVGLKGIITSPGYVGASSLLTLAMGRTTDGEAYVTNLTPMPHLLVAGATGSGKSVCIHSVILSLLYKAKPDEVKLLLIDPKRLELPLYRGLPHLYDPRVPCDQVDIITQPKEAAESLKKLVKVMEKRYEKFANETVRNIEGYNEKMAETGGQKEFYIVVIIDELADLILLSTKDVENSIQRLAQMARAVGIHLILATQRPSVDVITGVIKANFSARIAFQTTSKVDSRVILDVIGAEDLLGRGDMLFLPPGESRPARLQGAFVSVKETEKVIKFITSQGIKPQYEDLFARPAGSTLSEDEGDSEETTQELIRALRLIQERKRISQDLLKAHFGSSARATNILSLLETKGFIHKPEGTNRWSIYYDKIDEFLKSRQ
ncbi:MAG: DNA translocase FtsK 4TM domain-containing protein [Elusimicrobiota bacterium]